MPEPAPATTIIPRRPHSHGRGRPFNHETAKAASALARLAPRKPRVILPPTPAPIPSDPHAALVEEAIRLASRALRAKMPARVRADLMAAMAPFFREARLIAKDDPGAKGASRAGRRPEEPPCVLLEDHPGVVEPPCVVVEPTKPSAGTEIPGSGGTGAETEKQA